MSEYHSEMTIEKDHKIHMQSLFVLVEPFTCDVALEYTTQNPSMDTSRCASIVSHCVTRLTLPHCVQNLRPWSGN